MHGTELRALREERGVRAVWMADRLGFRHRQRITQLEAKPDVTVSELVAYTAALGIRAGDLLENSGGVRPDLRPVVDDLSELHPAALARVRDVLHLINDVAINGGQIFNSIKKHAIGAPTASASPVESDGNETGADSPAVPPATLSGGTNDGTSTPRRGRFGPRSGYNDSSKGGSNSQRPNPRKHR